ncbi:hypothetical protein SAY86_024893 [Trapa natans]|uniref:BZIP domain-containing protein n=1 Tax=Trapa natans TaxID=22666 RepID=A0AAN7LZX4_TRANT|nr:hypothetical protein SAY86_024893 [Trapa natans]
MGSQGGSAGGGGEALEERQALQPLSQQGSLYSLTLDEVQNQLGGLGKPLGSMNLDELLRSISSAEANTGPPGLDLLHGSIQSQRSFSISQDLCKKTVDDVWRDIQRSKKKKKKEEEKDINGGGNELGSDGHQNHHGESQPTLGEMTLEDFLVNAGIRSELTNVCSTMALTSGVDSISAPHEAHQWMHYEVPLVQSQQSHQNPQEVLTVFMPANPTVQQAIQIGPNSTLDMAYPNAEVNISPSLLGALSDTQAHGGKRVASGDVIEKKVERKQKRMIKNRESAARSRARKQAYTHELEHKVSRLEEENQRLRRQREAEKIVPCAPPPERKNQHRRTISAPF